MESSCQMYVFVAFLLKKKRSDDYYQEPTGRAIIQVNDETGENSIGKPYIYILQVIPEP